MKRALPSGTHLCLTKRGSKDSSMLLYGSLGRLFENGIDLDLSKLYPAIEFPVSRGTPMISPFIKWNHEETYPIQTSSDKPINEKTYSLADPDFDFISGHEIDGRVLFPATGYLYLAWKTLAAQLKENFETLDVEFEDVKFIRACQIQKAKDQKLSVLLQPETGFFQVTEENTTLATGTVRRLKNSSLIEIEDEDPKNHIAELDSAGFYKELQLRGYEYKKIFKSVVVTKIDGSRGIVKWQSNWIAFLDCILQNIIITQDSRSLKIPTGMKKVCIMKNEHEQLITKLGDNPIVEFRYSSELKALRCGGIEIRNVGFSTITRRPPKGIPVLESHQFVPHFPTPCFSKTDVGRFCVQLAIENLNIRKVSCVEIDMNDNREPLSEYFGLAANDLPVVTAELNFLTSKEIEIPLTTFSSSELSAFSDQTFVIRSNCLFDAVFLEEVKKYISTISYIVSRESKDCEIFHDFEGSEGYTIAAVIPTESETLVLMQYRQELVPIPSSLIKITNTDRDYSWLENLQKTAKTEPTLIYTERESQSGILGLVNCIRKEPGGNNLRCFFIDDESAPPFSIDDPFYKAQINNGLAINVYRNGEWGSFKHFLFKPKYEPVPCKDSCFAKNLITGDLSSVNWLQSPILKDNDDIVKVQYSALNFKDAMLATGKLSVDTVSDNRLDLICVMGLEFAGITKEGRRVMGAKSNGAMSSHVIPDEIFVWNVPDHWTLEEAVTIPIVYGTVYYSFFMIIKIEKGKSILIHAGSGGIGLAAIRVAFAYGLEVFTTVSTEEKKNFLLNEFPELKPENIGNSRDTSFEDMIRKQTRGVGVDYVLNSLSEEKLAASVRCLGKGGKFLEIGKFDMAKNNNLSLEDFLRELTFHAVVFENMLTKPIEEKLVLKKLIDDGIADGTIKPLKTNVFNADQVESAFRLLSSGKHIGKVVLKIRENESDNATLPISVLPRVYCNPEYSYIICGGLGGFGLELADWLILRGCRKIVLNTSRGITKQFQSYRIKSWESYGVQVQINKSDITTRQGCEQLIDDALILGPIGGIFNLALQLRDSILENQTIAKFDECMGPKAYATKYLDEISRLKCPELKYFVVFSSISCGRGNAGQSNYGMANSVMERIIEERHKIGLPGKAIQWGAIGDVGIVADLQEDNIDMEIGGTLLQSISSCLEELDTLMTVDDPTVSSMVVAEKRILASGKSGIMEMLMNIMSIKDIKSISMETKLSELGMDSLMSVEISQSFERNFNIILTPQELRSMTIAELKELEKKDGDDDVCSPKIQVNLEQFVLSLGDESTSNLVTLQLNNKMEDNTTKALIFPGIEGVGGKVLFMMASQIKYQTYALQCMNIWNISDINEMCNALIEDIAKLYENDTKFLFIAPAYGSILALKLAKMLENRGITGRILVIDGSPILSKTILNSMIPKSEDPDAAIETLALDVCLKLAFPDCTSNRRFDVISEPTWEAKMKKFDELYTDFKVYSKEYIIKAAILMKNRIKAGCNLSLDDFSTIKSPIKLLKASEALLDIDDKYYGLRAFSDNEIEVTTIEGDYMTIYQNLDMYKIINSS